MGVAPESPGKEGCVWGEGGNGVLVDMCRLPACWGEGPRAGSGRICGEGGDFPVEAMLCPCAVAVAPPWRPWHGGRAGEGGFLWPRRREEASAWERASPR